MTAASSAAGATPPRRSRARALAGATLVAAAVVVVAIVATTQGGHASHRPHRTVTGAATVSRRNLVTSENETGTISYARSSTVADRLQGTLTWVPVVGSVIDPGQRLFDVDNFPVILLNGTTPAYRTLTSTDTPGPDIAQLNADLIRLGFDPYSIVNDDEWQPATTDGVEAFQEANGEPATGRLVLGTIVFMAGAQRVSGLQGAATNVSDDAPGGGQAEFVDDSPQTAKTDTTSTTSTTDTTSTTTTSAAARSGRHGGSGAAQKRTDSAISRLGSKLDQLQRENRRLQKEVAASSRRSAHRSSSRSSGGTGSSGGGSGPQTGGSAPVLTTSSTNLVVTVNVSAGQQTVTHVGARVPVVMPSGATVHGHVTKIGAASSSGGNATVPITIRLDRHENGRNLDQASVSVTFVERTARDVLSVPVTALLARPGGRYAVQEAAAPYRLIDVTLGTFATGYVQVSGAGLRPGLRVTDSQG